MENLTNNDRKRIEQELKDAYSAGLMCERILSKDKIERLEAERNELRNKVIEECIEALKTKGVEESDYNGKIILSTLNSLKK